MYDNKLFEIDIYIYIYIRTYVPIGRLILMLCHRETHMNPQSNR